MAKYAYAPLSHDENRRRGGSKDEDMVNERMPMCVGVLVLVAIVYVLSRTGVMVESKTVTDSVQQKVEPPWLRTDSSPSTSHTSSTSGVNSISTTVDTSDIASEASSSSSTLSSSSVVKKDDCTCEGLVDPATIDLGKLREKAFANTPPHIIECAKAEAGSSQSACHLPSSKRFKALGQKGATLWMTGCSGSGKTTIATILEDKIVKKFGKHVYRLDGDNLRTGLNRDLTFTEADRAESVRRTGELSMLFADSGVIVLVGLISPYRGDRDLVRKRHEDQNIPFYEVFLDVPVEELKKRDPKGQYARVAAGELKHFTCIDDPYEEPLNAEITLKTHTLTPEESAEILFQRLLKDGVFHGAPMISKEGLPNPDGDEIIDLHVPANLRDERTRYAENLPKVLISDIDLNWLQVIAEGWAAPLKGFMREGTLLEVLHFNSILVDPADLTGNADHISSKTDFNNFPERPPPMRLSMSVPITLTITDFQKDIIEESSSKDVALTTQMGHTVAILKDVEIYNNRREEIISRLFGAYDAGHPYIKNHILKGGDYLIGGELEVLDRIRYNDGLDKWRKTATEIMQEFKDKNADTVYAFQTRNPTHAGHAYLMRTAGENLKKKGFKNPVLWLSPLGGWTKSDDVPLDVRIQQHEHVLDAGLTHPGGLDPDTTVMAIWPSPMLYAGPTEVQFHAKSRRSAGASYFVVGRDPAGIPRSDDGEDLYDGDHGRYVLQNAPGIAGNLQLLSFVKVMYDITDNIMKEPDASRLDDFISISGTKMRLLARNGASPCSVTNIPTDLVEANCIPSGFMVPKGWNQVVEYYKNIDDSSRWIPWSQPWVEPFKDSNSKTEGRFGSTSFRLFSTQYSSLWHDVPIVSSVEDNVINMITEIPMFVAAKMELNKKEANNPIAQDLNKDGSARYYTYGVPFFNYGFVPQTWEDPSVVIDGKYGGDDDPLDVIELGSTRMEIGSITPCRVLGSLELVDQGEMDYKILCISLKDPQANQIHSLEDLEKFKPGIVQKLVIWLKRYKTSDGKGENILRSDTPNDVPTSLGIIREQHARWKVLCGKTTERRLEYSLYGGSSSAEEISTQEVHDTGFWLDSKACRGS